MRHFPFIEEAVGMVVPGKQSGHANWAGGPQSVSSVCAASAINSLRDLTPSLR